jgi:hypothetical protein
MRGTMTGADTVSATPKRASFMRDFFGGVGESGVSLAIAEDADSQRTAQATQDAATTQRSGNRSAPIDFCKDIACYDRGFQ